MRSKRTKQAACRQRAGSFQEAASLGQMQSIFTENWERARHCVPFSLRTPCDVTKARTSFRNRFNSFIEPADMVKTDQMTWSIKFQLFQLYPQLLPAA